MTNAESSLVVNQGGQKTSFEKRLALFLAESCGPLAGEVAELEEPLPSHGPAGPAELLPLHGVRFGQLRKGSAGAHEPANGRGFVPDEDAHDMKQQVELESVQARNGRGVGRVEKPRQRETLAHSKNSVQRFKQLLQIGAWVKDLEQKSPCFLGM